VQTKTFGTEQDALDWATVVSRALRGRHDAVETAMRRSDIASLAWEHVDLCRKVAHLPKTKTDTPRDEAWLSTLFPQVRTLVIDDRSLGEICASRAIASMPIPPRWPRGHRCPGGTSADRRSLKAAQSVH
jgi:integrase